MHTPKLVEAERCAIYPTLKLWYENNDIRRVISTAHPALVFNADETQISVRGGSPGKVLCKPGERPSLAVDDNTGTHVTLFPVISAMGRFIDKIPVLHGPPDTFVHDCCCFEDLCLLRTKKGYMDKATFYKIMVEIFIPYVNKVRDKLLERKEGLPNKHAVLIVDGHKSRYYGPTFIALQEAGIFFIILPAHSSHITQPLDLCLNGDIKRKFREVWNGTKERNWTSSFVSTLDTLALSEPVLKTASRLKFTQKRNCCSLHRELTMCLTP